MFFYLQPPPQYYYAYYTAPAPTPLLTLPPLSPVPPPNPAALPPSQEPQAKGFFHSLQELPTIASEHEKQAKLPEKQRRKRQKNVEKQLVSARKNSESNIINHFFSYFCNRECSEYQLRRTVLSLGRPEEQTEKISAVLYNILKVINLKRGRRYINKIILAAYFSQEGLRRDLPDLVAKIEALPCLTLDEACLLLRKCFSLFIREVCLTSILTSKRISTSSKAAHLQKRRKITFQLHASAPIN